MPDAVPPPADPAIDADARASLDAWRASYVQRLAAPDGWWATCALHWLSEGPARAGSAPDADLLLPAAFPDQVAILHRSRARVTVEATGVRAFWCDGFRTTDPVVVEDADRTLALGPDADALRLAVLVRGADRALRAYDPARAALRDPTTSVDWYPLEPGWVVPATFVPAADGEIVPIVTIQGDVREQPAAGRLRFRLRGEDHALLATRSGDALFVMLRDAGSGPESYGAGRYLRVATPENGRTILDFHRLYHPPCAHSTFATCPLPPLENRLPFVVRAGERTGERTA